MTPLEAHVAVCPDCLGDQLCTVALLLTPAPVARGGGATMSKLETAFWAFHEENPHVYAVLTRLARAWFAVHGDGKLGIGMLFERARWEVAMETRDDHGFKLNNNHRAYYARLIMLRESDLSHVFSLRQQQYQATFGPDNATLPPGDHVS